MRLPRTLECLLLLPLLLLLAGGSARAEEPAAVAGGWGLPQLMAELAARRSGEARFTETKHLASLKTPLVTEGLLRYRYPDSMEKAIEKPRAERYVIAGEVLEIWRGGALRRQLALAEYPVMQGFMTSFIATIGGDLDALRRHYAVDFAGDRESWSLHLKPLAPELGRYVLLVAVRGSGASISHFELVQQNGDRSLMLITPAG